jgi:GT2 family glycosyltransferase
MSSLRIVVVNYRSAGLALECLRSLAAELAPLARADVVVVDNASGDGSVERLAAAIRRERWQGWVALRPLARNGGFAFGNNAAIRDALGSERPVDYLMLLNPDTVVRPGAIRALLDFMDSHPRAGIAGSRLENAAGEVQASAHRALSPLAELEQGASLDLLSRALGRRSLSAPLHECAWVAGASLIVRRQVFEQIGLLDEGYFLYFEEVDFCVRARKAGWKICFVPGSRVVHLEGAATGIGELARRRPAYWYDSRRRYFVKHFGVPGLLLADALWAAGRASLALRRLLRLGRGGRDRDPKRFAFDLLWGDVRSCLTGKIWQIRRTSASS